MSVAQVEVSDIAVFARGFDEFLRIHPNAVDGLDRSDSPVWKAQRFLGRTVGVLINPNVSQDERNDALAKAFDLRQCVTEQNTPLTLAAQEYGETYSAQADPATAAVMGLHEAIRLSFEPQEPLL